MTKDDIMSASFLGLLNFAIGKEEILKDFEKETGVSFLKNRSPIERMVDRACGKEKDDFQKFIDWIARNYWDSEESEFPSIYFRLMGKNTPLAKNEGRRR